MAAVAGTVVRVAALAWFATVRVGKRLLAAGVDDSVVAALRLKVSVVFVAYWPRELLTILAVTVLAGDGSGPWPVAERQDVRAGIAEEGGEMSAESRGNDG